MFKFDMVICFMYGVDIEYIMKHFNLTIYTDAITVQSQNVLNHRTLGLY